jgi:integrase
MGTVHQLPAARDITLGGAAAAYLATLAGPEQANTRRAYSGALRLLGQRYGTDCPVAAITADSLAQWFTETWGARAPGTWNARLDALRSAAGYWLDQGWIPADPTRMLRRRKVAPDRDRALSRERVDELLTRESIPLRDRLLWRMLYETAGRASEILGLDVPDLDLPNRRARVTRKGGAQDVIVWQTGTARLLPRYLRGRTDGPLFVTDRRARVQLPASDLCSRGRARLGYRQALDIFRAASGGATLHQLRHSALTHDAESGTSTPMLMARSGHTSVRSLAKYARVSAEALQRHQEQTDPARRRR